VIAFWNAAESASPPFANTPISLRRKKSLSRSVENSAAWSKR
jgi:hypothetical protein